ncbi:MAG: UDP-N-acetylglucosamine 1-carboxyvinyltransferase [Planctomycetes bacterium]|nr:UDP-N-acetylglucosamine 1-carboxyvinyltransferase [Planctomycetota bacterium]MDP6425328.1 UDP-N-acetylglucosamine 1-carboxyvinyltransferase [Planctomycetota bacterium]
MDRIRIRGGHTLSGSVCVSGSKNACLPILAACLMVDGPVVLEGVPHLKDVDGMLLMLGNLGIVSSWQDDGSLRVEVVEDWQVEAPYHLVRTMRASFCLLGPLWAKRGRAVVSYPGGCVFGHRPVDLHLKGLEGIGAKLDLVRGNVHATGPVCGGTVYLGGNFGSTVLGTANVLMAATLGQGETIIDYAAQEPEIVDLCHFLQACGADISGIGTHRLTVRGVPQLHGCRYRVIPDRIEAGTLLVAGILTRGVVEVLGARPDHMAAQLDLLRACGVPLEIGQRELFGDKEELGVLPDPRVATPVVDRVRRKYRRSETGIGGPLMADRVSIDDEAGADAEHPFVELPFIRTMPWDNLECVDAATLPYPGFPTDLQAQFLTLMCIADGVSVVTEKVYPERFIHIAELARLGARIRREGPAAIVEGGRRLKGARMTASDLRASAALVLAGLVAEGPSDVHRVYHLDRGYENLHDKLAGLGADIERVHDG